MPETAICLLDDGTNQYTYDAAMRLTATTDGVSTPTFAYNGDGERVAQTRDPYPYGGFPTLPPYPRT